MPKGQYDRSKLRGRAAATTNGHENESGIDELLEQFDQMLASNPTKALYRVEQLEEEERKPFYLAISQDYARRADDAEREHASRQTARSEQDRGTQLFFIGQDGSVTKPRERFESGRGRFQSSQAQHYWDLAVQFRTMSGYTYEPAKRPEERTQ